MDYDLSFKLCHIPRIARSLRIGEWDWGWVMFEGKPTFTLAHTFYDVHSVVFHCYKFWIQVDY